MDRIARLFGSGGETVLIGLALAILASVSVLVIFIAIVGQVRGKPKPFTVAMPRTQFQGIKARLEKAQLEISPTEYVRRSLTLGIPLGFGLYILIGSIVLAGIGILAGFLISWTKLEQERDRKTVRYTKQLAGACDTIRASYGVNPSLKKALEAVAEYGQSPVKEDFQEILLAASQERFVEGLHQVAERRRSIVFDTVANSLVRANEATGEVGDMLQRLAESTRQNVAAFEDALTSQINARSNIQWGTYGPWLIFCVFRVITLFMGAGSGASLFAPMVSFFTTPVGNIIALLAALISIAVYRYALQVAQRGLVVRRTVMTDPQLRLGQQPLVAPSGDNALSAQSRPVTVN